MAKSIFPAFLTAEIAPETGRNLARFEQMHAASYSRIASAASRAGQNVARQAMTPATTSAGAAAARAAAAAQASASAAMQRTAREASNAARAINTQNRSFAETSTVARAAANALKQTATGLQVVQGPLGPVAGRLTAAATAMRSLSAAAFGFASVGGLLAAGLSLASGYADVRSQLSPLFETQEDLNRAMRDTTRIAVAARQGLQPVAELYSKLTVVGREFNWQQERVARLTQTIAKAARLSGGSAQSQEAGITQLSQGLGSGVLQGDELRSVRENTLRLARAIAQGLGVSIADLKTLGEQGVLTSEVVASAIERSADRIERETARMQMTPSAAWTTAKTQATAFIGRIDDAFKATSMLANALVLLSSNLDTLAGTALAVAGIQLGGFAKRMVEGLAAAKALGVGIQGLATHAALAAQQEAAAARASVAAQQARAAAITKNIALLKAQHAAEMQAVAASRANAAAGFGRLGGNVTVAAGEQAAQATTNALIRSRGELRKVNAALTASETALAAAQGKAAATAAAMPGYVSTASRALTGLRTVAGGLVSFLGGPWGIAFGAAAAAVYYFSTRMSESEKATQGAQRALEQYGKLVDSTTGKLVEMSSERAKALAVTARNDIADLAQQARNVQGRVAADFLISSNRLGISKTAQQFAADLAAIRNGGKEATDVYARVIQAAENGNEQASKFLKRNAENFKTSQAIARQQKAASESLNLALGGVDPKFSESEAVRAAEATAQRERGEKALARMVKSQNTLNDNDKYVKNLETAYEQLTGIADLTDKIATKQTFIEQLRTKPVPKGEDVSRRSAIRGAEKELADLRKLQADARPQAEKWAQDLTKAQTAQRDYNRELRDHKNAATEADSAEKKRLRTLEQIEDKQRQVADILGRYEDDPRSMQRALEQIRRLKDLEGDVLADGTRFSAGDLAAQSAAIVAGMRRDIERGIEDKERELVIDRLLLAGREREAAMLQAKWAFQREFGTAAQLEARAAEEAAAGREREAAALRAMAAALPELERRTKATTAAAVDQSRAQESARRLISIYEQVPQSLQQGFESVWENVTRRGIKSARDLFNVFRDTFRRFQAQIIGEQLFGGLDRQIGDMARPGASSGAAAGARAAPASLLSQAGALFGLGSSQAGKAVNKELVGVTEENSAKLEALGATITRAASSEQRSAAAMAGAVASGIGLVSAGVQAAASAAAAAANAAAGTGAAGKTGTGSAVDAFNAVGKSLGIKLDKVFGTAGKAGKSGALEGLGGKAGTAMAAYTLADTFTSVLGIKGVAGGAIKGAATGAALAGPWGAVAGALIGGLSSAFKKTAKSSATISSSGGSFGEAGITGTSSKRRAAAGSLGEALEDAISGVVDQLDATLGDVRLSIGTRKKKFVLDPTGAGRTKGSGVQKFDTEQEAVEAGLRLALQRGVVQGISAASQRILQSGQDLEKAIEKASLIESVPKRLMQLTDPARYAVEELNKQFVKLIDALIEGGATAEQIADAEKLYGLERAAAIEAAQQSMSDSIDRFLSDIRAGSASPLGARATYENAAAGLSTFRADIDAGKAVDDDKLVEALQTFYDASRALNGSRAAFFEDYADVESLAERARAINRNAVTGAPDEATLPSSPFESGDRAAKIDAYLQKQNQLQSTNNDILAGLPQAIADAIRAALGGGTGVSGSTAFNYLPGIGGFGFGW